jgi:hypothetical protein
MRMEFQVLCVSPSRLNHLSQLSVTPASGTWLTRQSDFLARIGIKQPTVSPGRDDSPRGLTGFGF